MGWLGCLVNLILLMSLWGIIAYLIFHPPGVEDIPWFIAGGLIFIILYKYRNKE